MRRILILVAAVSLGLVACGDDDGSPSSTVPAKNLINKKTSIKPKIATTTTSTILKSNLGGEETDGVAPPLGGEETDGVAPSNG